MNPESMCVARKLYEQRNWLAVFKEVLSSHSINSIASKWVIANIHRWTTLDELRNCEDLTPKQVRLLQVVLVDKFNDFAEQRELLVQKFVSCGTQQKAGEYDQALRFDLHAIESGELDNSRISEASQNSFSTLPIQEGTSNSREPDVEFGDQPQAKVRKVDSEHCFAELSRVLRAQALPEEAISEIEEKIKSFDSLKSGLESCMNLTQRQVESLSEKLQPLFNILKRLSDKLDVSLLVNLDELSLQSDAIQWLNSWLHNLSDGDHPDISQLEQCRDLTKLQRERLENILTDHFKVDGKAVFESGLNPRQQLTQEIEEILNSKSFINDATRSWILTNIPDMEDLRDLSTCDDLTEDEVGELSKSFEQSFQAYKTAESLNKSVGEQASFEEADRSWTEMNSENTFNILDEMSHESSPVDWDCEFAVTPLILSEFQMQEGVSVEKFVLTESGVKSICNLVPAELIGETPVYYETVVGGPTVQFDIMDQIQIKCVGLFGPLRAVLRNLRHILPNARIASLEEFFDTQMTGLYLLDISESVTKFLVLYSKNDVEFASVKSDSKAVHFLRYMSQLCDNVVMCLDENYEDRFTPDLERADQNERRIKYELRRSKAQQESFTLKNLGFLCENHLASSKIVVSQNGLIALKREKVGKNCSKRKSTGTFTEVKEILESCEKIQCFDQICEEFMKEYLVSFQAEAIEKLQLKVNEEVKMKQLREEQNANEIVMFSLAIYYLKECRFNTQNQILQDYYTKNSKASDIWNNRISFEMSSITDALIIENSAELEKSLKEFKLKDKTVEKFLLWTALKESENEVDGQELLTKDYGEVSWQEINAYAKKKFTDGFTFHFDYRTISEKMKKAAENLNFEKPSELLDATINEFLEKVFSKIEPHADKANFLTLVQKYSAAKFEILKTKTFKNSLQKHFEKLLEGKLNKVEGHLNVLKSISMVQPSTEKKFHCVYDHFSRESVENKINFYQIAVSRSERERLFATDDILEVRELGFHRTRTIHYPGTETMIACYPLENDQILIIFNVNQVSKFVIYNLTNASKPFFDVAYGKTISAAAFDSLARVLAVQSQSVPGVIYLFKFGPDYKSRQELKSLDLRHLLKVDVVVEFCLQPNSGFLWFIHKGRLRKMNYKTSAMVNEAINFDKNKEFKLKVTPDGTCLLVVGEMEATPVMTKTGNILAVERTVSHNSHMFRLCDQSILIGVNGSGFDVYQVIVTGSEQHTKLIRMQKEESHSQTNLEDSHLEDQRDDHWLNYIYWMYCKFPCNDLLQNCQNDVHFWYSIPHNSPELCQKVVSQIKVIRDKLTMTHKPLDFLKFHDDVFFSSLSALKEMPMSESQLGRFLIKLITFIPVQIARCQSNEFSVLRDGRPISLESVNVAFDLVNEINLGFYESILNAWKGDIKVISSMGKQSTGKSYTLNHLTGSSFSIAATRCTDGCWMTLKEHEDCLYVILDFEGLGSDERTEQDDMLLSLFSSSISTITIFKTEKRLDKDVDKLLNKINLGSDQLKKTEKVFMGKFVLVINDVAEQDVKDSPKEFEVKIGNIVNKTYSNFITKLYNSDFEIAAFPSFESAKYYQSIQILHKIIRDEVRPVFTEGGSDFLGTMKLLMAKLAINDFSPLDRQQINERIHFLSSVLPNAVTYAQITDEFPKKKELDLNIIDNPTYTIETEKQIELEPFGSIILNDFNTIFGENFMNDVLEKYKQFVLPSTANLIPWRDGLETFLSEIIKLRFERVQSWVLENLRKWKDIGNPENEDAIQNMLDKVGNYEALHRQQYKFCNEQCMECFLKCCRAVNHEGDHNCSTNHQCTENCEYCHLKTFCRFKLGHDGEHVCAEVSHICGQSCRFLIINGCRGECGQEIGHDGEHKCAEKRHPCKEKCSLEKCEGRCVIESEEQHTIHKCIREQCTSKCSIMSCSNTCSAVDHFHGTSLSSFYRTEQEITSYSPFHYEGTTTIADCDEHFCGKSHPCDKECNHEGFCQVWTERELSENTFRGKRGTFNYRLKFVAQGKKLKCRHKLEPFTKSHAGSHSCSTRFHFCTKVCPTCENICNKAVNHESEGDTLHRTIHGNMRKCFFVANEGDIQVGSHKYKAGEPAEAEMCHIFCNSLGRGHIHIVECDTNDPTSCVYNAKRDGRRHQTTKYWPHPHKPKDEITHKGYWDSVGFEDPCREVGCDDFEKCPAYCPAETHEEEGEVSYCELGIWHDPVHSLSDVERSSGILSKDGHVFACSHTTGVYHFVLCLDDSGSMRGPPWEELVVAVQTFVSQRIQESENDMLSIAIHNHDTRVKAEFIPIADFSASLLDFKGGKTDFSRALQVSDQLIGRNLDKNVKPVLIFMSDGICNYGEMEMEAIAHKYVNANKLEVYTLGFGEVNFDKLKELARLGRGQYISAVNGLELKTAFVEISAKHPTTIGISF
ncbi:uncharacterized protein LOC142337848 [Convolutriloba macropyga]|uniref:uncharacterized protein LOC142337848 n=1 Tax=Convolutriloba macropyga TaxID=536237 RepID=UPI003F51CA60